MPGGKGGGTREMLLGGYSQNIIGTLLYRMVTVVSSTLCTWKFLRG